MRPGRRFARPRGAGESDLRIRFFLDWTSRWPVPVLDGPVDAGTGHSVTNTKGGKCALPGSLARGTGNVNRMNTLHRLLAICGALVAPSMAATLSVPLFGPVRPSSLESGAIKNVQREAQPRSIEAAGQAGGIFKDA